MTDHAAREARQIAMFGCTAEAIDFDITANAEFHGGPFDQALAMSLLSDSQEQLERGQTERARQTINRAKYILSNVRDEMRLAVAQAANPHRDEVPQG